MSSIFIFGTFMFAVRNGYVFVDTLSGMSTSRRVLAEMIDVDELDHYDYFLSQLKNHCCVLYFTRFPYVVKL